MSEQAYVFDPGVALTLVTVGAIAFAIGLFVGRNQRYKDRPPPSPDFQLWRPQALLPPHEVWTPAVSPRATATPYWPDMPAPGEIWWATVPFRDGTGQKRRPCLIIRTHASSADVLTITSRDKSNRHDHTEVYRTASWDPKAIYNSYVNLSEAISLPATAFKAFAGTCSQRTWAQVTQHHDTGWVPGSGPGRGPGQW